MLSDVSMDLPLAMSTGPGTFVDLAALQLVTTASLARLAELAPDSRIHVDRFRPSLVIDTAPTARVRRTVTACRAPGEATCVHPLDARCVMRRCAGACPTTGGAPSSPAQPLRLYTLGDFACLGLSAVTARDDRGGRRANLELTPGDVTRGTPRVAEPTMWPGEGATA